MKIIYKIVLGLVASLKSVIREERKRLGIFYDEFGIKY